MIFPEFKEKFLGILKVNPKMIYAQLYETFLENLTSEELEGIETPINERGISTTFDKWYMKLFLGGNIDEEFIGNDLYVIYIHDD